MLACGDPSATHGMELQLRGEMDGPLGSGEPQRAVLLLELAADPSNGANLLVIFIDR